MTVAKNKIDALDWTAIANAFDQDGYALLPPLLTPEDRADIIALEIDDAHFRTRINMARHRFGEGRYGYFSNPIPPLVAEMREALYTHLVPIANDVGTKLGKDERYPATLGEYHAQCAAAGQSKPTPLLLQYEAGGYNRMHQDIYGDMAFPIQATMLLSDPASDFTGGEFLLAEGAPRQQIRAEAIALKAGETILFPCAERPIPGARGMLRARMRHGVSRIRSGKRYTLGIIFHNAA